MLAIEYIMYTNCRSHSSYQLWVTLTHVVCHYNVLPGAILFTVNNIVYKQLSTHSLFALQISMFLQSFMSIRHFVFEEFVLKKKKMMNKTPYHNPIIMLGTMPITTTILSDKGTFKSVFTSYREKIKSPKWPLDSYINTPVRKTRMSPGGSVRCICITAIRAASK